MSAHEFSIRQEREIEPLQSGGRENDGIEFRLIRQLSKARSDVSPNWNYLQIGPPLQNLGAASRAARGQDSTLRQSSHTQMRRKSSPRLLLLLACGHGRSIPVNHHIANVRSLAHATQLQTWRQFGRQILQAVHGQISLAIQQRCFEFFREEPFGQICIGQ